MFLNRAASIVKRRSNAAAGLATVAISYPGLAITAIGTLDAILRQWRHW